MTLFETRQIRPMLAETSQPFDSAEHYFEPKWDGLRCLAYVESKKVELQNRNLVMVTNSYPECKDIYRNVKSRTAVLDGEIVILEKGLPSFELLQNRFGVTSPLQIRNLAAKLPVTYIVFDLLHLNGRDLIDQPLSYRKERLTRIIVDDPHILLSQFIETQGRLYFRQAIRLGFEGVIAKKIDSIYEPGVRTGDWLKIKQVKTLDCIVAGYTKGTGGREASFGSLVMAEYNKNRKLVHIGNVGTGFSDKDIERMMKLLKRLHSKSKTIPGEVEAPTAIKWVKPRLVAEVGYLNVTRDNKLRLPRFIRLRLDGDPADCTTQQLAQ